jgi:regulator of sigma D
VIFSGAGKDQVSHWYPAKRHSLFTYFFMKGLKGDADKNKNKSITVSELKNYLHENVPYRARRLSGREQTPVVVGDESREVVRFR